MRAQVLLTALLATACAQDSGRETDCPSGGDFSYEGVALAIESGDSSFALRDGCAFFVSGSEQFSEQVRNAWNSSSYRDEVRPILLSVTGSVEAREDLAPVLRITSVREVTSDVSRSEAREQFKLRLNREPLGEPRSPTS
jgi:hypothetical protein